MTAKELFCWALSRESLVCCIRAGSALAYSRHREKVCLRSSCTFVFVLGQVQLFSKDQSTVRLQSDRFDQPRVTPSTSL